MQPRTSKTDGRCTQEEFDALLRSLQMQKSWSRRASEMRSTHSLLTHTDGRARQYGHTFLLHV